MSLNSAGLREVREEEESSMTSADVPVEVAVDPLTAIRTEAGDRLARELHNVRIALTVCYDEAVERLSDNQWVPLDLVTQLVNKLVGETAAERERAAGLGHALAAAKGEVQNIRAECEAVINATQAAAAQERKETAARFAQELNAAREAVKSAAAVESHTRAELSNVRKRCQEIVDAQMLQLVKFKRELEFGEGTPKIDRARPAANAASRDTDPNPTQAATPVATVVGARVERNRNGAPGFDAIEAALAESPPLGKWPSRAAV